MFGRKQLLHTLNIKEGEQRAVILLMVYSFFMGAAYAFFYTPSTSLFLQEFNRSELPLAYIVSGVLSFGFGIPLRYIQKRIMYIKFVPGVILFLLVTMVLAVLALNFIPVFKIGILYFLFVFARVFVFIMGIAFWGVAGKLFDIRQSKRIFSLINTGEVISFLISFFSTPFILKIKGVTPESLLFISLISLMIAFFVMFFIIKTFQSKLSSQSPKKSKNKQEEKKETPIFKNSYYKLIYFLAFMPVISLIFTDYIFFAQSQVSYHGEKEALASFLAIVLGINSLFEFVIKTFFSGKLITNYGVKLGLMSLPLIMGFCIFFAAITGSFELTIGLFFPFVTLSKLLLRSIRTTLYDPTFQIMYQPIPVDERTEFQSKIEAGPRSIGNIIAGIILFIFAYFNFFQLVHFAYIYMIIISVWIYLSIQMYYSYRKMLKSIIEKENIHFSNVSGESNYDILSKQIEKAKSGNYIPILNLVEKLEPSKVDLLINSSLHSIDFNNKKSFALSEILLNQTLEKQVVNSLPILNEKLKSTDNEAIKLKIEDTINQLEKSRNLPIEQLSLLTDSENYKDRIYAAKLIGQSKRYNAFKLTKILLLDKHPEIRREALITSGKIKREELWQVLIDKLANPEEINTASNAILMVGEPILTELDLFFEKISERKEIRLRIIQLIEQIGGEQALVLLRNKINYPDKDVRFRVLEALGRLEYKVAKSEMLYIRNAVEDEISMYVWIISALMDLGKNKETVDLTDALKYELKLARNRVFILLSLLYDTKTIRLIEDNIINGDTDAKGYALEIVDILVNPEIKKLILPVLEDLTYREILEQYKNLFPIHRLKTHERYRDIIFKDFSRVNKWTKALAIEQLYFVEKEFATEILLAFIFSSDYFLTEVSCITLRKIDPILFQSQVDLFSAIYPVFDHCSKLMQKEDYLQVMSKIRLLRKSIFFSIIPEVATIPIAVRTDKIVLQHGQNLSFNDEGNNIFYLLTSGSIVHYEKERKVKNFEEFSLIGDVTEIEAMQSGAEYKAEKTCELLRFNSNYLYELMAYNSEITNKISNIIKLQSITKKYD